MPTPNDRGGSAAEPTHALVITRVFAAARAVVWSAWTDPEQARRWWGPKDFTTTDFALDARPGGAWHAHMLGPDGKAYPQRGVVREVSPPERLTFTFVWDESPDEEMLITVTFAERDGRTEMTMRQQGLPSEESRASHADGWNECFDRLAAYVGGVDAPRAVRDPR